MQILANTQRLCLADMGADSHSESSDHTHECQNTEDYLQARREYALLFIDAYPQFFPSFRNILVCKLKTEKVFI